MVSIPLIYSASTKGLALVNGNGERLELKFWSSGLADQVYLALRLALAKVFSYQVESLPIILDDILVRFDENRQRSALELLAEIGKNQQIWYLLANVLYMIWLNLLLVLIGID